VEKSFRGLARVSTKQFVSFPNWQCSESRKAIVMIGFHAQGDARIRCRKASKIEGKTKVLLP